MEQPIEHTLSQQPVLALPLQNLKNCRFLPLAECVGVSGRLRGWGRESEYELCEEEFCLRKNRETPLVQNKLPPFRVRNGWEVEIGDGRRIIRSGFFPMIKRHHANLAARDKPGIWIR